MADDYRTRHGLAGRRRPRRSRPADAQGRAADRARPSVVFYDALVGPGVLDLVPPQRRLVRVGKRSGRHSKDQATHRRRCSSRPRSPGERVVRLKGGDPSIFGRSTEEIDALPRAPACRVRICPGITAASAAAASGIASLTLRGLARKLTFVTAHARAGEPLDIDWAALAKRRRDARHLHGPRRRTGDIARADRCGACTGKRR